MAINEQGNENGYTHADQNQKKKMYKTEQRMAEIEKS